MNKTMKILSIVLMAIMLVASISTISMAAGTQQDVNPGNIAGSLSGKIDSASQTKVTNIGNQIIGILTTVGVVIAVIVLLILGIKYMMGSASEKAEYKKTMIPYLVGAILIFGASAITKVVVSIGQGIVSGE